MTTETKNLNAASLDHLLIDENVFTEGKWVQPDPDLPLRIRTKPLGDAYADKQARLQRKAAQGFNGDTSRLPTAIKRQINATCLIETALLEVEGCVIGGQELSFEEFCDLILQPRGQKLLGLAFTAANMVTEEQAEELEEAKGN